MIRSFRHSGLEEFYRNGSKAGIQPKHERRLRLQLSALDSASRPEDMRAPGWDLHALKGSRGGQYAVSVNGKWRLVFEFDGRNAILLDYVDYH